MSRDRYESDERGSVRRFARVWPEGAGLNEQDITYDVWGNPSSTALTQPFGFAGGIYITSGGLWHFGARQYSPEMRRWTAPDPIGFEGGLNLYQYTNGDPVNYIDPSGLWLVAIGLTFSYGSGAGMSYGIGLVFSFDEGPWRAGWYYYQEGKVGLVS